MKFIYRYQNTGYLGIRVYIRSKYGGKGKSFLFGEDWTYKGYWILYHSHNGYLYRIWTTTKEKAEIKTWVRWFASDAFKKEHDLYVKNENHIFSTMPIWQSIPLGYKKSGLPNEDWADWFKSKGFVIQLYTPEELKHKEVSIRSSE